MHFRGITKVTMAALFAPPLIAYLVLPELVATGMLTGAMLVLGVILTLGQVPGFWSMTATRPGLIVAVLLTAVIVHFTVGVGTATGIIAIGYALAAKTWTLILAGAHYGPE